MHFFSTAGGGIVAPFSEPKSIKKNPKEKYKYITALKEALIRFIFVEEYYSQVLSSGASDTYQIERVPIESRNNLYSIFGVESDKGLYKKYKGDRYDVDSFRDDIEDMVRDALVRILGRGMPSKAVLKSLEEDIDTIIDVDLDRSPLLYNLLDQSFDVDKPSFQDDEDKEPNKGIFPSSFVGLDDREDESLIRGFIESKSQSAVAGL